MFCEFCNKLRKACYNIPHKQLSDPAVDHRLTSNTVNQIHFNEKEKAHDYKDATQSKAH